MDKELVHGDLGKMASYSLALEGADLVAKVVVPGEAMAMAALEWLKAKIPGTVDDMLINLVEAELAKLKA